MSGKRRGRNSAPRIHSRSNRNRLTARSRAYPERKTMTQTVDDVLHDLAARGEISHISLTPNSRGDGWCASFTMCSRFGTSFAEDPDPAQAIIRACATAKMKPRPAPKHHPVVVDAEPVPAPEVAPGGGATTRGGA